MLLVFLLDPISFYLDLEARTLLGYAGRLSVYTRKPGGDWNMVHGMTLYGPDLGKDHVIQARTR